MYFNGDISVFSTKSYISVICLFWQSLTARDKEVSFFLLTNSQQPIRTEVCSWIFFLCCYRNYIEVLFSSFGWYECCHQSFAGVTFRFDSIVKLFVLGVRICPAFCIRCSTMQSCRLFIGKMGVLEVFFSLLKKLLILFYIQIAIFVYNKKRRIRFWYGRVYIYI